MSKLDEMHQRPATHSMTARINVKYLATLIVFWRSKGVQSNSASELVRLSLETFGDFLVQNNAAIMVESTEEALEIIKSTGYKIGRVNMKSLIAELSKEDGTALDFLNNTTDVTKVTKKSSMKSDIALAQVLLKQQEDQKLQDRIKASQDSTNQTLTNLGESNES